MKKLGIVIPTHCRASWLKEALTHLMPYVLQFSEDVCVYVSDNASDDGTNEIVTSFLEAYPGLIEYHYHRNGIPYYENFNYGVEHIQAEYVFLHGDDDLISPYFIGFVLDLLKKEDAVGLIHFNYYLSNSLRQFIGCINTEIDFDEPIKHFSSGKELIKKYYNSPSFMGANVFPKECWMKHIHDEKISECYGYEWLYILFKGILEKPAIYVETPLFVQRFSSTNTYSDKMPLFFLVGLFRVFDFIDKGLLAGWPKFIKDNHKWDYYKIISKVYLNRPMYKEHYSEIEQYIKGRDLRLLYLCIFVFPTFFTKYFIFTYYRIRYRLDNIKKYKRYF